MRISDYIEALGEILAEQGDLQIVRDPHPDAPCVYSGPRLLPEAVQTAPIYDKDSGAVRGEAKLTRPKRVLL